MNGLESATIPAGIKDWVSGKLLSALPKRLVQRLLASLIENRNLADTIDFREKSSQNLSEFTLVMFKNEKAREKHQKTMIKTQNIDSFSMNSQQNIDSTVSDEKTIFENFDVTNPGLKFYSEIMLADHTQSIIPTNLTRKNTINLPSESSDNYSEMEDGVSDEMVTENEETIENEVKKLIPMAGYKDPKIKKPTTPSNRVYQPPKKHRLPSKKMQIT